MIQLARTLLRTQFRHVLSPAIPVYRFARKSWALHKFHGADISSPAEFNSTLSVAIGSQKPLCVNRIGLVELDAVRSWKKKRSIDDRTSRAQFELLKKNAGVYPITTRQLDEFSLRYANAIRNSDYVSVIGNFGEAEFHQELGGDQAIFHIKGIDPFYWENPWTNELSGKTVLVVSPFVDTIADQHAKLGGVWENAPFSLPKFELATLRAPLSGGIVSQPDYPSWTVACETLEDQMAKIEFDVAIIGAGAFAPHLAYKAKLLGKIGINLGGSTQILFGVRGKRWDNHAVVSSFFNENWVRPSPFETPTHSKDVEEGCYW